MGPLSWQRADPGGLGNDTDRLRAFRPPQKAAGSLCGARLTPLGLCQGQVSAVLQGRALPGLTTMSLQRHLPRSSSPGAQPGP